jgi:hypothetical protein
MVWVIRLRIIPAPISIDCLHGCAGDVLPIFSSSGRVSFPAES